MKMELQRQLNALIDMVNDIYGTEKMVLKAGKLEALALIRSRKPAQRLLGLQRLILENPTLADPPPEENIPAVIAELEEILAERLARRSLEESLEHKIKMRIEERHEDYLQEIKRQVIKEVGGVENSQTLKKYALTEKKFALELSRSALELLRPASLEEIVGQEKGVAALVSKLASPHPQHIILYGPPGVGKTTAARLALQHVKTIKYAPFAAEAPFVEVDGTTLRWDPREIANPLIGSVHDPIYQGARRDLIEGGVPEPKLGLVSEAHGGILFIDEIGEMDLSLQSKLLKVLEDKRVIFDSAYYDPLDPQVPKYIKMLFEKGAPADFILIGATTRPPEAISPALRSRCSAVYFEPLTPAEIEAIVFAAAGRLKIKIEPAVAELISRYTSEGRQAVNLLVDGFGRALYEEQGKEGRKQTCLIRTRLMQEVIRSNRLYPLSPARAGEKAEIGRVFALGVHGFTGTVLEIEAVAFPAAGPGKGSLRFNETAGLMTRDSVFVAATVLRRLSGLEIQDFDLHLNVVGGGNVNGPSAGAAIFIAILSAIKHLPVRQDCAITGELSLRGLMKPVGGLTEKIYGARLANIKKVLVPEENKDESAKCFPDMKIVPAREVSDLLPHFFHRAALGKLFFKEGSARGCNR
jgi:ATP-dependent Lon protease